MPQRREPGAPAAPPVASLDTPLGPPQVSTVYQSDAGLVRSTQKNSPPSASGPVHHVHRVARPAADFRSPAADFSTAAPTADLREISVVVPTDG
eukprot:gene31-25333_t